MQNSHMQFGDRRQNSHLGHFVSRGKIATGIFAQSQNSSNPYPNPEPQQRKNAILPAEASVFISKRVQYKSCSIQWTSNTI